MPLHKFIHYTLWPPPPVYTRVQVKLPSFPLGLGVAMRGTTGGGGGTPKTKSGSNAQPNGVKLSLVENIAKKELQSFSRDCGSFDHPDLQSINDCKFLFLVLRL